MNVGRNAHLVVRTPSVVIGRRQYVLILSHMRSYSSLFAHLLGSHPEIDGYAEMNQPYTRSGDLLRLRGAVARSIEGPLTGRFVLDKVLHNHHRVSGRILSHPEVWPIFLVRKPAETIASILKMNDWLPEFAIRDGERGVAAYYTMRLGEMAQMSQERGRHALVIRSEDLVSDPEGTLDRVALYLRLDSPISTSYSTFPLTGEPGRGDYSDAILEGRIRHPESGTGVAAALNPDLLAQAERAYARCLDTLDKTCEWRPHPDDAAFFPAHTYAADNPLADDY